MLNIDIRNRKILLIIIAAIIVLVLIMAGLLFYIYTLKPKTDLFESKSISINIGTLPILFLPL